MTASARFALGLLAAHFVLRLALAVWLPLGADESYAVAVGRSLSISFFDHPPIGFWMSALLAQVTGLESPLIYRLPFVVMGTVTGWALWRMGCEIGGARVGLASLALWLIAPHMVLGSSLMAVPDAPMNMGLALAALVLIRADLDRASPRFGVWVQAGAWVAFAVASKYQAALFAVAVLGALALHPRLRLLLRGPGPWAAGAIAALGLVPVLVWNLQTDWASFRFHSGRTGGGVNLGNLLGMSLAQLGYLLPPVAALAAVGIWRGMRRANPAAVWLLAWLAVVPLGVFALVYLFGTSTYAHWTMSGWIFALPLGALVLVQGGRVWRGLLWGFAAPVWGLALVLAVHLPTGFLTARFDPAPEWDRQMELIDLSQITQGLANDPDLQEARILAVDWMQAGQIATALQGAHEVRVLGPDQRHFAFLPPATTTGPEILVVLTHALAAPPAPLVAEGVALTPLRVLGQDRGGRPYAQAHLFAVVR